MRIAMVGTRGVPARYGGFETAVEEVGSRLAERGHEVLVYCRGEDTSSSYLGMDRVRLPALPSKSAETLSHTALSVAHLAKRRADAAIVFNAANAPFLPLLRAARIPYAVHMDGLEWKRAKWGPTGRRYYLACERMAVKWSSALIADAVGIQDYYRRRYDAETVFIPYGAPILREPHLERLADLDLTPQGYHVVVARLEPENHVDVIVQGYVQSKATLPLVVVGSVPYASEHSEAVKALAASDPRVRMIGSLWDQELLDALYAGSASYLHGHSVGGTNPSLLRAMGAGTAVTALDVDFNREVLGGTGLHFTDPASVAVALEQVETDPESARKRGLAAQEQASTRYRWDDVALQYEELALSLASRGAPREPIRTKAPLDV
ncbi:MAG: DUF1972 domain-containing protein [Kineosporiaceae bacterium]